MNPIEFYAKLQEGFPEAVVSYSIPLMGEGVWFFDFRYRGRYIPIAWKKENGFGVVFDLENHSYGEGADEVFSNFTDLIHRLQEEFNTKK